MLQGWDTVAMGVSNSQHPHRGPSSSLKSSGHVLQLGAWALAHFSWVIIELTLADVQRTVTVSKI